MLLSFNDICIIPSIISNIESRSECCPYRNNMLPLITAPMSSVIDENNWQIFRKNKINTIIPRSVDFKTRCSLYMDTFIAVSLSEFEYLINHDKPITTIYICVDIANGHMKKLLDLCKQAKEKFGDSIQIMAGNIANPETYYEYANAGIDYIRCGIGTSPICTTSANSGVHYPMVSLLQELIFCKIVVVNSINQNNTIIHHSLDDFTAFDIEHNSQYKSVPKIIADGGFSNFDQIIKALAIGADYVMLGKIFAMSEEACGEIVYQEQIVPTKIDLSAFNEEERAIFQASGFDQVSINKTIQVPHRKYYGMSTKKAQSEFGNTELKTAEGIETLVPIKYTLAGWCDNFISYLRSAMSYCNSKNLDEFKKNATIKQISNNSFNSYFK